MPTWQPLDRPLQAQLLRPEKQAGVKKQAGANTHRMEGMPHVCLPVNLSVLAAMAARSTSDASGMHRLCICRGNIKVQGHKKANAIKRGVLRERRRAIAHPQTPGSVIPAALGGAQLGLEVGRTGRRRTGQVCMVAGWQGQGASASCPNETICLSGVHVLPDESCVQRMGPVGGTHDQYAVRQLHAVHLSEE